MDKQIVSVDGESGERSAEKRRSRADSEHDFRWKEKGRKAGRPNLNSNLIHEIQLKENLEQSPSESAETRQELHRNETHLLDYEKK